MIVVGVRRAARSVSSALGHARGDDETPPAGRAGQATRRRRRRRRRRSAASGTQSGRARPAARAAAARRHRRRSTCASSTRAGKPLIDEADAAGRRPGRARFREPARSDVTSATAACACASTGRPTPCRRAADPIGYELRPGRTPRRLPDAQRPGRCDMSARAGIVVTGTEVLSGIIRDRNGPWLSERLRERGVELAHIDRGRRPPGGPARGARLPGARGHGPVITTGGLGPTADDLTADVVAGVRRPRRGARRGARGADLGDPRAAARRAGATSTTRRVRAGNRKQALVPRGRDGARAGRHRAGAGRAGRRPGRAVVVLPGPPRELQPMWAVALETDAAAGACSRGAGALEQRIMRLFGIPESEIARTLRDVEAGACRSTAWRSRPACGAARSRSRRSSRRTPPATYARVRGRGAGAPRRRACSPATGRRSTRSWRGCCSGRRCDGRGGRVVHGRADGGPADRPRGARRRTCWAAWSCTRTRRRWRSPACRPALIARFGAVSPEVAAALADGRARRGSSADLGIGITGIAGPGGGTPEKPVGTVCLCVRAGPAGDRGSSAPCACPGDRAVGPRAHDDRRSCTSCGARCCG